VVVAVVVVVITTHCRVQQNKIAQLDATLSHITHSCYL